MFIASMHNTLLLFTEKGKCFWLKVYQIPEGTRTSKGRAIQNILNIEQDDQVLAYINVKTLSDADYINNNFIILCTKKGIIKKTSLEAYSRPRQNGINAITIREGDELLEARLTNGTNEVVLAKRSGRAIRFNESTVRPMGRNAAGVMGVRLEGDDDEVIGMICLANDNETLEGEKETILVVSEKGYGKRSLIDDYRVTNRGGKGVKTINITDKTGKLISIKNVTTNDQLMIINMSGIIIRMGMEDLRIMGRATQGVRLIKLSEEDGIAAVAKIANDQYEDDLPEDELEEGFETEAESEGEEQQD
jgi:DNA gyrase subunit A